MLKIQSIRGMNDLLPDASHHWQYLEQTVARVVAQYGYREIRFPVLESTELFKRSIGEVTDIVEKEMYTFDDRNGDSVTLRPEGTAGCVRACLENGLLDNQQTQKLWYTGPMFRYERPQKGRLRQFHQIGVESFGVVSADIDAEMIIMTARLWQQLGVLPALTLELNSIGSVQARQAYRDALVKYLRHYEAELDDDSRRRLETNPMRILDSKVASTQNILKDVPLLPDYLDDESHAHFERLKILLNAAGVSFRVNPKLVRGLDYYSKTVFEWVTDQLGAQGTVCAGGRYDGLVEQLGGKPSAAVGFAMGVERLILLLQTCNVLPVESPTPHIFCISAGAEGELAAQLFAERVRNLSTDLRVSVHCGGGSFKSQFKRADKSGAYLALIFAEDEVAGNAVTIKFLRDDEEQITLAQDEAIEKIREAITVEQSR